MSIRAMEVIWFHPVVDAYIAQTLSQLPSWELNGPQDYENLSCCIETRSRSRDLLRRSIPVGLPPRGSA